MLAQPADRPQGRSRSLPAAFAVDAAQALASIDRLEGVEAAVIGFGHGAPWRGGVGAALAEARTTGRT